MAARSRPDRSLPAAPVPSAAELQAFRQDLIDWFTPAARDLPWRLTDDPYRIWVSEVMLQQTRTDQATPYYERFLRAFPTVQHLAEADLDAVLLCWEGLGYYSRARNLHRAARQVVNEFGGRLPDTYEAIRSLPGVGAYTAAAVLSLAYGRPHAVLDGNVARVLSRVYAMRTPVDETGTRRRLQTLADALLDPKRPGPFNEGMMELGATVCTPTQPQCPGCPLGGVCRAYAAGEPTRYPYLKKKAPLPHYDVAVGLIFNEAGAVLIQRRPDEGLLGGLWEFPGGKREAGEALSETCRRELREELSVDVEVGALFQKVSHAYTHFKITMYAFRCRIRAGTPRSKRGLPLRWVSIADLDGYAFPRANRRLIMQLHEQERCPSLFD